MMLLIELDGARYLADVGFGGMTLSAPIQLTTHLEQITPHGVFRLEDADAGGTGLPAYTLQTRLDGHWAAIYRFDLDPQYQADYAMSNHYVSTFPDSVFVNNLLAARLAPGRRLGLLNWTLSVHDDREGTQKHELADVEELRRVLADELGIRLPETDALDAALARLAKT
jgi:N-hydroxyarylamine O-acetyltransferase